MRRGAFEEIERLLPSLLEALRPLAEGGPCIDDVRRALSRASHSLGIRYALVFGSLARKGCGRDVDLVVKLDRRPRSLLDIGRLQVMLEDIMGSPVDLVVIDLGVPPGLAKVIVDEAVLVWGLGMRLGATWLGCTWNT